MLRTGSGTDDDKKKIEFGFYDDTNKCMHVWKTTGIQLVEEDKWHHVASGSLNLHK